MISVTFFFFFFSNKILKIAIRMKFYEKEVIFVAITMNEIINSYKELYKIFICN